MMSSKEPRGTPPRARRSPSAPLRTMSHTFPARRRYGASPVSAVRRAQYPSTASARRSSISTNQA
eukprot:6858160-Alexandrium_andersonii.AAC.1